MNDRRDGPRHVLRLCVALACMAFPSLLVAQGTTPDADEASHLEALGVRNVWEALGLVPGVQVIRDHDGGPVALVRGINFIFNNGNIKVLVDGVAFTQEATGVTDVNSSILLMPIQDVDRLEFMRGPGSAIHGDAAYLGLLNILTRRSERRAFVSAMPNELTAGGTLSAGGFTL